MFAWSRLTIQALTTASAMTASIWLAMPNRLQIVANESLFMK